MKSHRGLRILLLGGLIGLFLGGGEAQAKWSPGGARGGFGFFAAGIHSLDLSKMNTLLRNSGYATLPETYFTLGGGGFAMSRNWILGGEGAGLVQRQASGPSATAKLTGGYGLFDLGRVLWAAHGSMGALMFGFGGGGLDFEVESSHYPANFDEVLNGPFHTTQITRGALLFKVGLMGQFIVHRKNRGRCFGGMILGFDVGYILPLYESNWLVEEHTLGEIPDSGMAGPYVRISFGGGGFCNW